MRLSTWRSGTKIKPGDAAQYLEEGFHGDTAKATEGVKPGISTGWKDYGKGDVVCKETQNEVAYDKFENGKGEEGTHPPGQIHVARDLGRWSPPLDNRLVMSIIRNHGPSFSEFSFLSFA